MDFHDTNVGEVSRDHSRLMSSGNVIIKINHFDAEGRSVKMETRNFLILICLSALVAVIDGFDGSGIVTGTPTAEDCMKPPMTKFGHECCRVPKERIWGDLRPSMEACFRKMKQDVKPMRQEMSDNGREQMTPESVDMMTPTEDPNESGSFPNSSPSTPNHNGRRKKPLSERLKDLFSTVYKEIKSTINSIWQSVVIITDHFRRRGNDSCFMECVFQDEGFLLNKMVNKAALLARFDRTLAQNEVWHKVAVGALETCFQTLLEAPSNNNTCTSGSEEIFRCVFKQMFFNCPNWTQSEYCLSLKEFYQKCPQGPPPEINDNHSTSPVPPPSVEESTEAVASDETESSTQLK